jgi:hypothetical protein
MKEKQARRQCREIESTVKWLLGQQLELKSPTIKYITINFNLLHQQKIKLGENHL